MKYSVVIPCYRSQDSLPEVVAQIEQTMAQRGEQDYEVVLVNDCSPDDTWNAIVRLSEQNPRVIGVNLAKNSGQHAALLAGFRQSVGEYVVTSDDDLQTPIERMWELKDKLDEGYDLVCARYVEREARTLGRRLGTYADRLMKRWLFDNTGDLYISVFFMARRFVIDEVARYDKPFPYLSGLVLRTTRNIANVDMTQRKRAYGSSGYTLRKLLSLWLNGFTAFSLKPLRLMDMLGAIFAAIGMLFGVFVLVRKLLDPSVAVGWSSIVCVLLFVSGVQMLMVGMLGEYMGRTYLSINGTPQSVVRDVVGTHAQDSKGSVGNTPGGME